MKLILLRLFLSVVFFISSGVVFEVVMDLRDGLEDVNLGSMMTILNGRVRPSDGDSWGPPGLIYLSLTVSPVPGVDISVGPK